MKRIVVLGAGFGGMQATIDLARSFRDASIVRRPRKCKFCGTD